MPATSRSQRQTDKGGRDRLGEKLKNDRVVFLLHWALNPNHEHQSLSYVITVKWSSRGENSMWKYQPLSRDPFIYGTGGQDAFRQLSVESGVWVCVCVWTRPSARSSSYSRSCFSFQDYTRSFWLFLNSSGGHNCPQAVITACSQWYISPLSYVGYNVPCSAS